MFAVAYDSVVPGFDTFNSLNMRLWSAKPSKDFDFQAFNSSDYIGAIDERRRAEEVSYVLYPNDKQYRGFVMSSVIFSTLFSAFFVFTPCIHH